MFDRNGNKIEVGHFLRDIRFGQHVFVRVTEVVYNTRIDGLEAFTSSNGAWVNASARSLHTTNDNWVIVPADAVPVPARERIERAR